MAKVNWEVVYGVINSIPSGRWMSYGDVCEASGLSRSTAKALGLSLSRRKDIPKNIYRVLRQDGGVSAGWRGEIGTAEDCIAKLKEEGVTFNRYGLAEQRCRFTPRS